MNQTIPGKNEYAATINHDLRQTVENSHTVLDLFAGCGGLSLGFESAGFQTLGMEKDKRCCDSYNRNLCGECENVFITPDMSFPNADVLVAGPPCQPFSVFGNQKGSMDERDGFPSFISAVRQAKPKFWMFENVRGMLYKNIDYLHWIISKLNDLGYVIDTHIVNMSKHGVPQNRIRVITVGHDGGFEFPLDKRKTITNREALDGIAHNESFRFLTPAMDKYIAMYEEKSSVITPRDLHLDRPARTVTCRNLGGATSDMLRIKLPNGKRRMLTIREGARLQGFPDWFEFAGTNADIYRQIGNAVPPVFAQRMALSILKHLDG